MRVIAIYRPKKENPATPEHIEAMGKFIDEAVKAGVLLATEGFGPSTKADARVRLADGQLTVTDGPFAEAKEVIGGFAIMQAETRAELIEWTKRFLLIAGDGESEIRHLHDMSPIDALKKSP